MDIKLLIRRPRLFMYDVNSNVSMVVCYLHWIPYVTRPRIDHKHSDFNAFYTTNLDLNAPSKAANVSCREQPPVARIFTRCATFKQSPFISLHAQQDSTSQFQSKTTKCSFPPWKKKEETRRPILRSEIRRSWGLKRESCVSERHSKHSHRQREKPVAAWAPVSAPLEKRRH